MIATVESIVLDLVVDALVECDQEPTTATRHHGQLPDTCCTDAGVLSIHWEQAVASSKFPTSSENDAVQCGAIPTYTLFIRWLTCWPAEPDAATDYELRDEVAARIATVTDCVLRALIAAGCSGAKSPLFELCGTNVRVGRARPVVADGGCAGVVFTLTVGVRRGVEAAS